jgi:RimJ/RimL family protein N-acetyltransferase
MTPGFPVPTIQTPRLTLRPFALRDFDGFAAMHPLPQAEVMWGQPGRDAAWARLLQMAGEWTIRGFGHWAMADRWSDAFLGHAGFHQPHDADEPRLIIALTEDARGRGLAEEGVRAVRDWGRAHGIAHPVSLIHPHNARAIRLAERLGALPEGTAAGGVMLRYRHPVAGGAT